MAKVGRPTKFDAKLHPARAIELGKEGHTLIQIAADFGISKTTLYTWCEQFPEFLAAIELSRVYQQAYLESIHLKAIRGEMDVNINALHKALSCRFPEAYNPAIQVQRTENITIKHDALGSLKDKLSRISRKQSDIEDIEQELLPGPIDDD